MPTGAGTGAVVELVAVEPGLAGPTGLPCVELDVVVGAGAVVAGLGAGWVPWVVLVVAQAARLTTRARASGLLSRCTEGGRAIRIASQ